MADFYRALGLAILRDELMRAQPTPPQPQGQPTTESDRLFGYKVRDKLFPGEDAFFKENPKTTGMAAETGDIIFNPYSSPRVNREAVAKNEAFRLLLRDKKVVPDFEITEQQRKGFEGTAYAKDDSALRATIAARIYSGDPSAQATKQQTEWVSRFVSKGGPTEALSEPAATTVLRKLGVIGGASGSGAAARQSINGRRWYR